MGSVNGLNKEPRMLVLTRRSSEQIVITFGEETVFVRVLEVGHDRVRLGVIAPKEIAVHREEVARRIAESEKCEVMSVCTS
jgi:carbon storage regulator